MVKPKSISYLSHGKQVTGGYLHEQAFTRMLAKELNLDPGKVSELRKWKYFESISEHIQLFKFGFNQSVADLNICVSRLALPALLRNLFTKKKVIIIWHYFSDNDNKSRALKYYFRITFWLLKQIKPGKACIVTVAPFWKLYFKQKVKQCNVFYFPNLINPEQYQKYRNHTRKKQIHLGQASSKNDPELKELAKRLSDAGYSCYFSTNNPDKASTGEGWESRYFARQEDYLEEMGKSLYTLAMTAFNEGWNRVAHESILCGTPVIGYDKGGLGDLLKLSGSAIVNNTEEAFQKILNSTQLSVNFSFSDEFHPDHAPEYLLPIVNWCMQSD